MLYLPSTMAAAFCQRLEALARVPERRARADMESQFGVIVDLHGDTWLEMDSCADMVLDAQADLAGITELMQAWVDDGLVPAETLGKLLALLESRRGELLFFHEAFPQVFKDQAKSRRQMIDEGLLEHPAKARAAKETETMVTLTLLTAP
jgi:hypothetical protein